MLAHDYEDAGGRECLTLDEGLDHFAGEAYAGVELDVDLKLPGYEREVVEGLAERGLAERSLDVHACTPRASTGWASCAPGLRRGWSVPRVRRDYTRSWLAVPAYAAVRVMRARLPGQAAERLRAGGCEAIMVNRLLASSRLIEAVHGAGGEVYVWTVDDAGPSGASSRWASTA